MNSSQHLKQLVRQMGMPLKLLPEIVETSPREILDWWRGDKSLRIDSKVFERLSLYLGINEATLLDGTFDLVLARQRIYGDFDSLPEKYINNPNSFLRTSEHIHKYMILTRGQHFADKVLADLNVSPLIYNNTNRQINLTYFAELLDCLAEKGFSDNELDTLASVIFLSLRNQPLGQKLQNSEDLYDVYSTLSNNFHYFDSNFEYQSQFIGKKYVLTTTLPLDHHKELKKDPSKIRRLMRYRHILLAWFPYLAGMIPAFAQAETLAENDILKVRYTLDLNKTSKPPLHLILDA